MPAISASAPAKIILFGEHAVVYGHPAIAVPVTQVKAKAIITPAIGSPQGTINIDAPAINLEGPLKNLPFDNAIAKAIDLTLKKTQVAYPPAFNIKITSTIPVAAGLGSGAAVTVAIIQAVSGFVGQPLPNKTISNLAFEIEKIHHGTPSGIDNTVVTYAAPVYFIKAQPIEIFEVDTPFTIVIGDTGIPSSTAVAVADVRKSWRADPNKYYNLFDKCGKIAKKARQAIQKGDIENLGPLMDQNDKLLVEMGVSSDELGNLVIAARESGALGAKLSGGGQGGNIIALVHSDQAEHVANALREAGATNTIITQVGE